MQNIDILIIIQYIVAIGISAGALIYWRLKHEFKGELLLYTLLAYAVAIALKYVVQLPTINYVIGSNPAILGLYYGAQTAGFEVGFSYVVARFLARREKLTMKDAAGFGLGLGFWENAVLLGGLQLVNLFTYYAILSTNSALATTVYTQLSTSSPGLFAPPSALLGGGALFVLERTSSLLAHLAWGYLCVVAACTRKLKYFWIALPMGFIDFLVPFAPALTAIGFEALVFALSLGCVLLAWFITKGERNAAMSESSRNEAPLPRTTGITTSLTSVNFKRSINYGKTYLILGIIVSVVMMATLSLTGGSAAGAAILSSTFPLIVPMFAVIGCMGALMIFTSDKVKGVYEYLIAYGINPFAIFWSIVASAVGLTCIILAITVPVSIIVFVAVVGSISPVFGLLILYYTIPLSIAAAMFITMAGMIWSSLSTRKAGLNSPVGAAPILGIAPVLVVLLISTTVDPAYVLYIAAAVSGALILLVILLIGVATKKLVKERFLANV
jgi:hypothetical protein